MTRSLLSALIFLLCVDIVRAEDRAADVSVREPLIRLVRRAGVEAACGVRGVAACTAFVGQRLDCACERSESGWQLRARAQFIPVMVLTDATWAAHENEHVEDIREAVTRHLVQLRQRQFESAQECEAEAERESAGFTSLMDRFKLESNTARHPRFARMMAAK